MHRALASGRSEQPFSDGYIHFRFGKPHRGYIGRIARAVLDSPAPGRRRSGKIAAVRDFAIATLSQYRAVLDGLVAVGKVDAAGAHLAGNCRPSGFHVQPHKRPCGMPNFCPACWSRRAVESWLRVNAALFPSR